MKKPAIVYVFQVMAALSLLGCLLGLVNHDWEIAIICAVSVISNIAVASILEHVAAAAHYSARTADAIDAMNLRELRREQSERQARAIAETEPVGSPEMDAEADRIRRETRARAGL